jgi:hypothetical protein
MCPVAEGDVTEGVGDVSSSGDQCGAGGAKCEVQRAVMCWSEFSHELD